MGRNQPPNIAAPSSSSSKSQERMMLVIGFVFAGGFLLAQGLQNWIRGNLETHPEVVALILITYASAFFLMATGLLNNDFVFKIRDAPIFALGFAILVSVYVISHVEFKGAYRTDALAFTHYSATLYLNGTNPYAQDLQEALKMFAVDPQFITLMPNGDLVSTLNYPALHFLIFVPAVLAGISDMRYVLLLFELATVASIYLWCPRELRPVVILPLFAGSELAVDFTAGCVTDYLWVLPLVWMVLVIEKPHLSGLLYGLACGVKQTPWLLVPFLVIWIWNTRRTFGYLVRVKRTLVFIAATSLAFVAPNAPFMIDNYAAWYEGVVTPAFGNLVVLSQGLSVITQVSGVPLPPTFYMICVVVVFLTLIVNYMIYFDRLKHSLWVFPAVTMWFSYRGLQNYFIYWIPLLMTAAVLYYREELTAG